MKLMPVTIDSKNHLLDLTTSIRPRSSYFSSVALSEAERMLAEDPAALFRFLITDIESECSLLVARRIISGFFNMEPEHQPDSNGSYQDILSNMKDLSSNLDSLLKSVGIGELVKPVIKYRAPVSLIQYCWLDNISQPSTEPALIVNHLNFLRYQIKGRGNILSSLESDRHRTLENYGIFLADLFTSGKIFNSESSLMAVHALLYLSLSRAPLNFIPEIVGVTIASILFSIDDKILNTAPVISRDDSFSLLNQYYELCLQSTSGKQDLERMLKAIALIYKLELEFIGVVEETIKNENEYSLDSEVMEIIHRHIRYAGKQHQNIKLGKKTLVEWFENIENLDQSKFLEAFRNSHSLKIDENGSCRFLQAIKFDGSMFGIFDEKEAKLLSDWILQDRKPIQLSKPKFDQDRIFSQAWLKILRNSQSIPQLQCSEFKPVENRELLYIAVNIENYGNYIQFIKEKVLSTLEESKYLFKTGDKGQYTDASYFEYSAKVFEERIDSIYWAKLIDPYEKLDAIPGRDEVIFGQKLTALGSLVDGAWARRIGTVGRYDKSSDGTLLNIYFDEMGNGNVNKNHITLIKRVLGSMDIKIPHIREPEFMEQAELPDLYDFALHLVCLSLFPDSFYEEILGYNLGIEMLGLGEVRLHEIQKLKYHGIDAGYEKAHLTIDNYSSGHARQSMMLIIDYMEYLSKHLTEAEQRDRWEKIWTGYASFALYLETDLTKNISLENESKSQEYLII